MADNCGFDWNSDRLEVEQQESSIFEVCTYGGVVLTKVELCLGQKTKNNCWSDVNT